MWLGCSAVREHTTTAVVLEGSKTRQRAREREYFSPLSHNRAEKKAERRKVKFTRRRTLFSSCSHIHIHSVCHLPARCTQACVHAKGQQSSEEEKIISRSNPIRKQQKECLLAGRERRRLRRQRAAVQKVRVRPRIERGKMPANTLFQAQRKRRVERLTDTRRSS